MNNSMLKSNNINTKSKGDVEMAKNKYKEKHMAKPVENHETAAWANQSSFKAVSRVNLPDEEQIKNAKEHVDTNQK